jgi:hypothetical protein
MEMGERKGRCRWGGQKRKVETKWKDKINGLRREGRLLLGRNMGVRGRVGEESNRRLSEHTENKGKNDQKKEWPK